MNIHTSVKTRASPQGFDQQPTRAKRAEVLIFCNTIENCSRVHAACGSRSVSKEPFHRFNCRFSMVFQ